MKAATSATFALSVTVAAILIVWGVKLIQLHLTSGSLLTSRAIIAPMHTRRPAMNAASSSAILSDSQPIIADIARMKDPDSRQRMIDREKIKIATSRGPLLRMLQPISKEKLNNILNILAAAELDTNIAMLELHSVNPSPSREQVAEILEVQAAARDSDAHGVLDDTQYAQYTSYWKSEPFTQTIGQIADVMRAQGSDVPPDLQQKMLTMYASAQTLAQQSISSTSDSASNSQTDPASSADAYVDVAMSKILSLDELKTFMNAEDKINSRN